MRLLLISQYFHPESFRINQVAEALAAQGCKIVVLTGQPNYPVGEIFKGYKAFSIKQEKWGDIDIIRLPIYPRKNGSSINLLLYYLSFVISGLFIAPFLLAKHKIDLIFVYAVTPITKAIPALFIKALRRIPVVLWIGDLWPDSLSSTGHVKNRHVLKIVELLVKGIYATSDLILVQSRGFIEPVMKICDSTPIQYFPNPEETMIEKSLDNESLRFKNGFNVLFAGNLGTVQALDAILDAAELLLTHEQINFNIVGNGSRSGWLEEQVLNRGLKNVYLPGRVEPDKMPALYQMADVLLVTLSKDPLMAKTVPSKVQTYLSAGKPIIAALEGEGAKILEEAGCGIIANVDDPKTIADAVISLQEMTVEERNTLGGNGRNSFMINFEMKQKVNELMEVFDKVALKKREWTTSF